MLPSPIGPVGAGLCWELIRTRTAARLLCRVQLVVGGSCWWTLPDDADADSPLRSVNLKMLQQTPVCCARLLGVPVIHGSHACRFAGFFSPDLPDVPYDSSSLGEAMIVNAAGQVLARRRLEEGAGVVIADVVVRETPHPLDPLPPRFWIPADMPEPWKDSWERWFEPGALYYETVTLPYLETGELNEYVPAWMSGRRAVTAPTSA